MGLREWITKTGVGVIAKKLSVTESCVRHWRRGHVLPDPKQWAKIMALSNGKVNLGTSLKAHFAPANKKRWTPKSKAKPRSKAK